MGKHEQASDSEGLLQDQRGVIYVEYVLTVAIGLVIAGLLASAGLLLLARRFHTVADVVYSGVP